MESCVKVFLLAYKLLPLGKCLSPLPFGGRGGVELEQFMRVILSYHFLIMKQAFICLEAWKDEE